MRERVKAGTKQKITFTLKDTLIDRITKESELIGVDRSSFLQVTLTMYFAGKDGLDAIQWAKIQQELQKAEELKGENKP